MRKIQIISVIQTPGQIVALVLIIISFIIIIVIEFSKADTPTLPR